MSGNVGSETGDSGSGEGEGDDSCTGSGTGSGSGAGFFRRLLGFLAGVGAGAGAAVLNVGIIKKVNPSQRLYTIVLLIDLRLYPFVLCCVAYNELKEILVYLYDASVAAFFRASFSF